MAVWTTAYINDLPDSCFLYIEPGGEKDEEGKTVPRSKRHLPYRDRDGKIDLPHLRNAIARLAQPNTGEGWLTEELRQRLLAKARRLLAEATEEQEKSYKALPLDDNEEEGLLLGGWAIIFGGQDLEGDSFHPETDFNLECKAIVRRPVYYEHGFDPALKDRIGWADLIPTDVGVWAMIQLERHNAYVEKIRELAGQGVLGLSSGSAGHLVMRENGKITRWPIVEVSLTPTPAEPRTLGVKEIKSLGIDVPEEEVPMEELNAIKEQLSALGQEVENVKSTLLGAVVTPKPEPPAQSEYVKSFNLWLRTGNVGSALKAALGEGSGATGGYIVPAEYHRELVTALAAQSILRQAGARVIRVSTNQIYVARMAYGSAATIVSEAGAYPEVEPTLEQEAVTLYKFGRLAKVSEELMADAMVDVWRDVLMPDFVQAFAAAENTYFTTGTGSSQPEGILTGGTLGKTTASATAITSNEVIDLYYALNYLYRQNAVWMMNDSTAKALRQLKDSNGQYLWQPGLAAGTPDTLLGRPVITNNAMPQIAASAKVIAFGDFSYFWIFESGDLTVQRLNELYAANGQVGFRAFRRLGSVVMLPAAIVYMQMASA